MRIIIFAIIIYAAYLLLRLFFRSLASKPRSDVPSADTDKPRRRIDLNNIEDADFEEIKKD